MLSLHVWLDGASIEYPTLVVPRMGAKALKVEGATSRSGKRGFPPGHHGILQGIKTKTWLNNAEYGKNSGRMDNSGTILGQL